MATEINWRARSPRPIAGHVGGSTSRTSFAKAGGIVTSSPSARCSSCADFPRMALHRCFLGEAGQSTNGGRGPHFEGESPADGLKIDRPAAVFLRWRRRWLNPYCGESRRGRIPTLARMKLQESAGLGREEREAGQMGIRRRQAGSHGGREERKRRSNERGITIPVSSSGGGDWRGKLTLPLQIPSSYPKKNLPTRFPNRWLPEAWKRSVIVPPLFQLRIFWSQQISSAQKERLYR